MRVSTFVQTAVAAVFGATAAVASPASSKQEFSATIFSPPSSYEIPRTLYARTLRLTVNDKAGTLLSTWENYSGDENGGKPWFPIFRSTDQGVTWKNFSRVDDQVNGLGLKYQPHLYELPSAFAGYPAGSILLAGNSIPRDLSSTHLDLYVSTDKGQTWKFVSNIANGGRALPNNGETPVWEPFLLLNKGQLICYYSDQRDPKYGQKLVHQTTTDLKKWSSIVTDVTETEYESRPGMPTLAQLGKNGKWILTYENYRWQQPNEFQVYYKMSDDPLSWADKKKVPMVATDGTIPISSPYVTWTPVGGRQGTIVVTAASDSSLYLNKAGGDSKAWTRLCTNSKGQYTRSVMVGADPKDIYIAGGGILNGTTNNVNLYTRDITSSC
ncbi:unnamed protein product [Parajaminaea phylloscopi]